jgi:hypothetical protein
MNEKSFTEKTVERNLALENMISEYQEKSEDILKYPTFKTRGF